MKLWLVVMIFSALIVACGSEETPASPGLNSATGGVAQADIPTVTLDLPATASPDSMPISAEETELIDALWYADRYGVNLAEARRRLGQVLDISELQKILRTNEIFTFGGLFVEKEPSYRVVVQFTRDGEEIIGPYVRGGPLEGVIEVRTVAATEDELKIAQRRAVKFAEALGTGALGIDFHTSRDIRKNRVELIVPDPAMVHARARELNLPIPDNVVVVEGVAPRMMAEVSGVLVERSGCLRLAGSLESDAPSRAIVWQKHVFEITRVGEEVRIVDVELGDPDNPVIWNLGDRVAVAGASDFGPPENHAGEDFTERCAGPYVLISDVR